MVYTGRDELTIIEMRSNDADVSIAELMKVLVERPSNLIYCEISGKLVGIISTGDILQANKSGVERVQVNKKFIYLEKCMCGGVLKQGIFSENEKI